MYATLPWHIYVLQAVHAVGAAAALPSWSGIFTRHIGRGREALSWALDSSAIGIGAGISGIVGGIVAQSFGFRPLFVFVSVFGIMATMLCFLIKNDLSPKKEKTIIIPKSQ